MAGNLRFMALKLLNEKPRSGYGLVKEISSRTGWKPSYGSVYPVLENLYEEGLASREKTGRRKVYAITPKGKKMLLAWDESSFYDSMKENVRIMGEMTGQDTSSMIELLERMRKGEAPLGPVMDDLVQFRNVIFRLGLEGKIVGREKKIRKILNDARRKLKELE